MRIELGRYLTPAPLLSAAILAVGVLAPASASAAAGAPSRPLVAAQASVLDSPLATIASLPKSVESGGRARHRKSNAATTFEPATSTESSTSTTPGESSGARAGESGPGEHRGLHDRRRDGCHLSLESAAAQITAGETATLLGALTCPNGANAADELLTVRERQRGDAGRYLASEVDTASTQANGSFQLTTTPLSSNCVVAVHAKSGLGARIVVKVAPLVTLSGPATGAELVTRSSQSPRGTHKRLMFTGTVSSAAAGTRVALQREYAATGERWRTVAFGSVGPEGHFSFAQGFRMPGEVSVRAVVHPKGDIAGASEPLSYDIAQAQNPQLTILSSADPISAGQSTTITGVAEGAANESVTLFAHAAGQAFTAVAKDIAGAGGAYAFTVSPLRSTYYRVADATTQSTSLFEGFSYMLHMAAVPSAIEAGTPLTFSGTVVPAPAGRAVYLERENGSGVGFRVIGAGTVDAASSYSIVHSFRDTGTQRLRIKVPAGPESQGVTSEPFSVDVTASMAATSESAEPVAPPSGADQS